MSLRYRLQAYRELFQRYREVFSYFWQRRKNLPSDFFNEQEAEFLPAALSIQEKPVSASARFTSRVLIALLVTVLLWAILGKVDIIVNARGKIIPSEYTKTIASVEVAAVRALHVQEGQAVKAGQVLVELDSSSPDAEHTKAAKNQQEALLQQARAQALILAIDQLKSPQLLHPEHAQISPIQWQQAQQQLTSQYQDFHSKLMRINDEIARYTAMLPLAEQQARDYKILAQNHDVANHAWLEKEQAYMQLKGQLADAKNQRTILVTQTRKECWDMLTEGRKAELAYEQDAKRNRAHSQLLKLHAPVDGTVQQLNIHTIGGVVPAAQPLEVVLK
jgi:hemolysin D